MDCGALLWEAKRAKNWAPAWISKLKADQREARAELAVLVIPPDTGRRFQAQRLVCSRIKAFARSSATAKSCSTIKLRSKGTPFQRPSTLSSPAGRSYRTFTVALVPSAGQFACQARALSLLENEATTAPLQAWRKSACSPASGPRVPPPASSIATWKTGAGARCTTTVTRSRCPLAFTLSTAHPFSSLKKVTRSIKPDRLSGGRDGGSVRNGNDCGLCGGC